MRGLTVLGLALAVTAPAGTALAGTHASAQGDAGVLFYDDFSGGFSTSGPAAKWLVPRTDATISVAPADLRVAADGVNPVTGQPAFTVTVPQDNTQNGIGDHGKWIALAIPPGSAGSSGLPAFPVQPGHWLSCATSVAVQTFGTAQQPFGAAVTDAESDPRLANVALIVNDLPDGVLFDFTVTNREIWARYESVQLPAGGSNPASFAYAVPVASRTPGKTDTLAVTFDSTANTVAYRVDGRSVLTVTNPGTYSLDRKYLTVDHGGIPRVVHPSELACGVGMFTLLDDRLPGGPDEGLVRLAGAPGFYIDPLLGPPAQEQFVDNQSLASDRLWGQGAQFDMRSFAVLSGPAR